MKLLPVIAVIVLVTITGCSPSSSTTYYWGNYSSSLYDYKKAPDEKTLAAHVTQLVKIIEQADKKGKKVPPGIHAEYGYFLLKEGKEQEGMEHLDKEISLYPESLTFIKIIKAQYTKGKK